jgi:hypothetical protein
MEWLGLRGYPVYVPVGNAPDCDLVTVIDGKFAGVQVKTSTVIRDGRFAVNLRTFGGNRSWNTVVKRFSHKRCDWLFVLVADGRCWFVPAKAVHDGAAVIMLGGPKYAAYEVERGRPLVTEPAA